MGLRECVILGAAIAAVPRSVGATEPADEMRATRDTIHDYFDGEECGGYVLVGLGAGGLVAGGLLYRSSSETANGASYPLLAIGLLHLAAGVYVNIASVRRVHRLDDELANDAAGTVRSERERMTGVARQFTGLKIAEVVLASGGLAMVGVGWGTDRPRLAGAGLAIAVEAAVTFGFDVIAARRADRYRERLAIRMSAGIDPATNAPMIALGHAGRF